MVAVCPRLSLGIGGEEEASSDTSGLNRFYKDTVELSLYARNDEQYKSTLY